MNVKWGNLGEVVVAGVGITVVVVVMFALGVAAWARSGVAADPAGATGARHPRTGSQRAAACVAAGCFAVCLAVAAYGIDLLVPG